MIASLLKAVLVPGTTTFLIITLIPGTLLLYRRKDHGRAGKIWVSCLVFGYLALSIPAVAVFFVGALSPSYPPVQTAADARGATAIVVLGAGTDTYRSRGEIYTAPKREHALRVMEAARVYRLLNHPWVIVTGSQGNERGSEAHYLAIDLNNLGVDRDRIVEETQAADTRDHALLVPKILKEHGVTQFVLVTSQQHMARAVRTFRKVGWDPIPSTPDFYVSRLRAAPYLPREAALEASSAMLYDQLAMMYYWLRGWV
jgi:uncharacterized SAM-binding protein YcdF (DUF218 family)